MFQNRPGASLIEALAALILLGISTSVAGSLMITATDSIRHGAETHVLAAIAEYHLNRMAVHAEVSGVAHPDTLECDVYLRDCTVILDVGSVVGHPRLRELRAAARTNTASAVSVTVVRIPR